MEAAIAAPIIDMMDAETLHVEGGREADSVQCEHTKEAVEPPTLGVRFGE